ncbi:lysophospholipid acyltransferase family protein [Epibacterium sp. MM17-32]|uniref:lysophospholipid acyltransferase family protein n=1 Tax=Epibacterium sp. MM17-32 TaxID=2917734 RepID=UPI001EF53240|nr:lysophospholipid acyltransferase family protein [Epibacterium sp. MM17-32]MCG7628428.1 lysophospholipid acyltransferase family protein [Epibacterium sp. MM17-32]
MPVDSSELTFSQRAKYFAINLALRGLIGGLKLIPYRRRVPAMGWVLRKLAPLIGFHKRVRRNLAYTRPDLPASEVESLCHQVADNVGRTLAELYAGAPFWARAKSAPLTGPGVATLEAARAAGRPVVLVTGHFGNYDAARSKLVQMGFNMGSLYRRMANPYFNDHYVKAISATGKPMFEQGKRGMVEMVRHLKAGGNIAIVADMHAMGGQYLPFFGRPALTSTVPAELALKYNAVFLPIYGVRQANGLDFEVHVAAEIPHSDPLTMSQAVCDDLERMVRAHMGQWFWLHRRWKPIYDTPHPDYASPQQGEG